MANKIFFAVVVLILFLFRPAHAAASNRELLGEIDGYLILTTEDDQHDGDDTVVRTEFSLWKDLMVGSFSLEPYYYFRNESNPNSTSDTRLTENMVGLNWVIQQSPLEKITTGVGYKYRYKSFGDNTDNLLVTQFRMDF